MRKIGILAVCFIIYTFLITSISKITILDKEVIRFIQALTDNLPKELFLLPDCALYITFILASIIIGSLFFIKIKEYKKVSLLIFVPILAYILNKILKFVVNRPRPIEYMKFISPSSSSFPSTHSLVSITLFLFLIYLLFKYSKNKVLNYTLSSLMGFWIIYIGFSRVALGAHHPTDVFGAYFLGIILVLIFIKIEKKI